MDRFLAQYSERVYAVMRIMVGLLFLCYGLQKAFGLFGGVNGAAAPIFSLYGVAGWIELITGAMIAVGLATAKAAFIASGHMAAAYFIAHAPNGFWPIENGGVAALLFCFIFLFMATRGSGSYSVQGRSGRV